jgi:hypothetical protein
MHRSIAGRTTLGAAALLVAGGAAWGAETEPQAPKPGPEHAKLAAFAGTWSGEADLKTAPGGKVTWTETCDWFDGHFHLVCKSSGTFPTGKRAGMHVFGYDAGPGAYLYFNIDSTGAFDIAVGSVTEDAWTFASERPVNDEVVRSRYVLRPVSATSMTFTYETQHDDGPWTLLMQGGAKKAK